MGTGARGRPRGKGAAKASRTARKHAHNAAVALQAEQQGERIAPAAQRHPVVAIRRVQGAPLEEQVEIALDGRGRPYGRGKLVAPLEPVVLRGARLERDGKTFIISNPIRHLVARGRGSDRPMFTKRHADAAETLRQAWEEAGEGVSVGVAGYDRVRGSNIPQTGYISDGVLAALDHQIAQREKITRAHAWLGAALWRPILFVVIRGLDVSAWAAQDKLNRQVAIGYLAAALDRLAECLNRQRAPNIRSAQIGSPAKSTPRTPDLASPEREKPHISDHADIIPA